MLRSSGPRLSIPSPAAAQRPWLRPGNARVSVLSPGDDHDGQVSLKLQQVPVALLDHNSQGNCFQTSTHLIVLLILQYLM